MEFVPLDGQASNLLFQLISKRYEKNSTIITSNKPLSRWGEIFADPGLTNAILDRLLYHAHLINIERSNRLGDILLNDE